MKLRVSSIKFVLAAIILLLLISACGGGEEPAPTDVPPAPTDTAVPTETPLPPEDTPEPEAEPADDEAPEAAEGEAGEGDAGEGDAAEEEGEGEAGEGEAGEGEAGEGDVDNGYPAPEADEGVERSGDAYPAPAAQVAVDPEPVAYPTAIPCNEARFEIARPLLPGVTEVTGTGPAGVGIQLIDSTLMGEVVGETIIDDASEFVFELDAPLGENHLYGLKLISTPEGVDQQEFIDTVIFPCVGIGVMDIPVPSIGLMLDSTQTSAE